MIPPLFKHQQDDIKFILDRPHTFNTSDPGTGKTRTIIEVIRQDIKRRPALVIAPKTILAASWGADIQKFAPELDYTIATPKNRMDALTSNTDIVLTNHDAVLSIAKKDLKALNHFKYIVIDESTAFKNHERQRSKALQSLIKNTPYRTAMSGTPMPNSVLDIWHQLYLLDQGARLGNRFYSFRNACCTPNQKRINGMSFNDWIEKPGIRTLIATQIQDITIRRTLDDCTDIPQQSISYYDYEPNTTIRQYYKEMANEAFVELNNERIIVGIHAAAQTIKMLQILSGAVYDNESYSLLDTERYDLVLDIAEQRQHSLISFMWNHQKHYLEEQAKKRRLPFATIDGETPFAQRLNIVENFQNGHYRILFAHPKSAGHGLTLTKAKTTIWTSPTYNLEQYLQFNGRTRRTGQTEKTEVICIRAINSIEEHVYNILNSKQTTQDEFLHFLPKEQHVA
jgi:SNF2 family DNA or RNA helicase